MDSWSENLELLIKSWTSLIWIKTIEEERLQRILKFTADRLLNQLGYSKLYNEENPFPFMNSSSLDGKTNFFESRVSEYNRSEQLNGLGVTNTQILDDF